MTSWISGQYKSLEQKVNKDSIKDSIQDIIADAPEQLDTLKELAQALNNNPNFASDIINMLNKSQTDIDKLNDELGFKNANIYDIYYPAQFNADINDINILVKYIEGCNPYSFINDLEYTKNYDGPKHDLSTESIKNFLEKIIIRCGCQYIRIESVEISNNQLTNIKVGKKVQTKDSRFTILDDESVNLFDDFSKKKLVAYAVSEHNSFIGLNDYVLTKESKAIYRVVKIEEGCNFTLELIFEANVQIIDESKLTKGYCTYHYITPSKYTIGTILISNSYYTLILGSFFNLYIVVPNSAYLHEGDNSSNCCVLLTRKCYYSNDNYKLYNNENLALYNVGTYYTELKNDLSNKISINACPEALLLPASNYNKNVYLVPTNIGIKKDLERSVLIKYASIESPEESLVLDEYMDFTNKINLFIIFDEESYDNPVFYEFKFSKKQLVIYIKEGHYDMLMTDKINISNNSNAVFRIEIYKKDGKFFIIESKI